MAQRLAWGALLLAVLASHSLVTATDETDETTVEDPAVAGEEVACALNWDAEKVGLWYLETSEHADKKKYENFLSEKELSGKDLDALLADADEADEALLKMGFDDAEERATVIEQWRAKKLETCERQEEEEEEKQDEALDPKYSLPPMTLGSSVACSACEEVVTAVWDDVLDAKPKVQEKSLKERRDAAHKIVDEVCSKFISAEITGEKYEETFLVHKAPRKSKKKKKKKKKKKADAEADEKDSEAEKEEWEDEEAEAAAAETEEEEEAAAEEEVDEVEAAEEAAEAARKLAEQGNPEDTAKLQEACTLMIANHGLKLKSKLAGFYKETNKEGLRNKMCYQWQDLCYAAPKPKLKKREKCLIKAYKAIANKEWEMAAKYTACAKKALKVKRKKSEKKDAPEDEVPEIEVVDPTPNAETAWEGEGEEEEDAM